MVASDMDALSYCDAFDTHHIGILRCRGGIHAINRARQGVNGTELRPNKALHMSGPVDPNSGGRFAAMKAVADPMIEWSCSA